MLPPSLVLLWVMNQAQYNGTKTRSYRVKVRHFFSKKGMWWWLKSFDWTGTLNVNPFLLAGKYVVSNDYWDSTTQLKNHFLAVNGLDDSVQGKYHCSASWTNPDLNIASATDDSNGGTLYVMRESSQLIYSLHNVNLVVVSCLSIEDFIIFVALGTQCYIFLYKSTSPQAPSSLQLMVF